MVILENLFLVALGVELCRYLQEFNAGFVVSDTKIYVAYVPVTFSFSEELNRFRYVTNSSYGVQK